MTTLGQRGLINDLDSLVSAKLVGVTQPVIAFPAPNAESIVAHCARVSSPREYEERSENAEGLLKYCIRNKHWSIFEMVNAVVEVKAPRDISRQLLRHRSFSFQEFSQRYSDDIDFCVRQLRVQDNENRQNSFEIDQDDPLVEDYLEEINDLSAEISGIYTRMVGDEVAKECARVVLPEGLTMSTLYVNGTLRSWLHYLEVREGNGTQREHVWLANVIREALEPAFPTVLGLVNE